MLGIRTRQQQPSPFEQGFSEATQILSAATVQVSGNGVLRSMGILPSEAIMDEYDVWNPAADRTTETRFGGDSTAFYAFQDGADAAIDKIMGSKV